MSAYRILYLAPLALLCHCTDRPGLEDTGETSASSSGTGTTDGGTFPTTTDPTVPPTTDPPTTTPPMTTSEPPTTDPPTTDPPTTTPTTLTTDPTTTTLDTTDPSTTTTDTSTTDTSETSSTDDTSTGDPGVFTPLALELADFDGDGLLDLLTLGSDEVLAVESRFELGHGDGTFEPFIDAGLASTSAFPTIGSLDTTPGVDVILDKAGPPLSIFRWVGEGPFQSWMEVEVDNILLNTKVFDGEKDGDGDIYALWATTEPKKFGLTFAPSSDGNFFFEPVDTQVGTVSIVGIDPNGLLVGDLNGDGIADALLFQSAKLDSFLRVFGTPQGAFAQPKVITPGVVPWGGELADMDNDLDLDVVLAVLEPPSVVTLKNDGLGNLTVGDTAPAPNGFKPFSIKVADLVGDASLDVAAIDDASAFVTVWTGEGDGTLDATPSQTDLPSPAVRVLAGKIDGDDKADLVLATFAAGQATVILSP
jgi:hypothetical protein